MANIILHPSLRRPILCLCMALITISALCAPPIGKYDVFPGKLGFTDAENALYKYLAQEAYDLLDARAEKVASISTKAGWEERQAYVRETLLKCVGGFPERTPLNAKVTRTVKKEGYRVEHVIYESLPGYYVTASMFIPDKAKKNHKTPAILYCSGHSVDGRMSPTYIRQMQNFVLKGFIVLAFDPIGQGERIQYLKEDGITSAKAPTKQHSYPGTQMILNGLTATRYAVWDGIRSIDYLLSRSEVDPARIGVTGRSGGGTQTAMISAMDERVAACSPENYLTTYKRLLQTMGPQDAEQNYYRYIDYGLDQTDLVLSFAPKPLMMITTTNDIFNVQGVKEIQKEMERAYKEMGSPSNYRRIEDYAGHEYTRKNNEANYAFFSKNLGLPCDTTLLETVPLTHEEMYATEKGNVYTSLGGETLFSLNLKETEANMKGIVMERSRGDAYFRTVPQKAMALSGYRDCKAAEPIQIGAVMEEAYTVEKYVTKGEGDYSFPYVIFRPKQPTGEYVVYLNAAGKSDPGAISTEIEPMVSKGVTVLAPDLVGYGEMGPGALRGDAWIDGVSHNMLYLSNLIGRSLLAVKTADMVSLVKMLKASGKPTKITGVANGEMAAVLLHAAAFCNDIDKVVLTGDICSYYSLASQETYDTHAALNIVPGALKAYDLPDLAASLAPRPISVVTPAGGYTKSSESQLLKEAGVIRKAFSEKGMSDKLQITGDLSSCF